LWQRGKKGEEGREEDRETKMNKIKSIHEAKKNQTTSREKAGTGV
jgi:hypothetical protein